MFSRKSSLFFGCIMWWVLAGHPIPVAAQVAIPQPKINGITVSNVGPQTVSESLVRANIRLKVGDVYNYNALNDDVKNLLATGYFSNVRVAEERTPEGVNVLYLVQGRLKITDILFSGNKKKNNRKLLAKVTSKVGQPLDERKLFTDAQEIKKLYEKSGYPRTEVKAVPAPDERTGRASVTFEIKEASKVRIGDVVFDGADAFSQRKLRGSVKTRRWWWLSWLTQSGHLKEEELDDDKDRLAEFYREAGYIDFDLKDVKQVQVGPSRVELHFFVTEGRQYKVGAVDFKGVKLFPTNEVSKGLKMGVGETFTPKGLSKDTETVQDLYGAKGYIDTRILPRRSPNVQTGKMDLTYDIEEKDKVYIEKIEIKGNTKTKDKVIRRELSVAPGEIFDMVKVKRSKARLQNLNFFEEQFGVDAQPEPSEVGVPSRRNLVISVKERNTGNLQVGAGFTSIDSLLGFIDITQGNFDLFNWPSFQGAGQKARLRLQVGDERRDALVSFSEPWFLERKLQLDVDFFHRELNFVSQEDLYSQMDTGMKVGLTRALGSDFLRGGVSYTLKNVDIILNENLHGPITIISNGPPQIPIQVPANVPEEIAKEAGARLVSQVGGSLTYDTRRAYLMPFLPTKGQRTELRADVAGGPLGGEVDYYTLEVRHARYLPGFYKGHLLELLARTGVAEAFDDTEDVPLFDRFFLGGLESLRGYDYRDIGPKTDDRFQEPIGGDTYWFATAEYSIPVIDRVRLAAFYDIGMVYREPYHWDFTEYADNWGFGIRLNLPIGPLRLDYGIPIHNSSGKAGSGKFQFSAGYTRDF